MKKVISVLLAVVMLAGIFSILPAAERAEAVTGIEYINQSPVVCYFETSGYFDTDIYGEEYFKYDGFGYTTGDILRVSFEGIAEPIDYVATFNEEQSRMEFVSGDGDVILLNSIRIETNQETTHYTVGSDNYYNVCYKGFTAPVQVTVVESDLKAVEYIPVKNIEIYENSGGEWKNDDGEEYYDYYTPSFKTGDIIRLTLKGNRVVDYTYGYNEDDEDYFFYDSEGNILEERNELFTTKGANGRWSLGSDNNMYIIYKDVYSAPVTVTIVENPVKDIKFVPAKQATYIEGTHMYYDLWDEAYYYDNPGFETGDVLTVTDKNNNEKAYTYNGEEGNFIAADGDVIEGASVSCYNNQSDTAWTVGSNNAYKVEYMGKSVTLYVTITENPVKSIQFIPAKTTVYFEGTHMNYDWQDDAYYYEEPGFQTGDVLKVTDNKNKTTSYTAEYRDSNGFGFYSADGKFIDYSDIRLKSDQREKAWSVGDNEYTVEYFGKTCTSVVKIVANPVDYIEYTPKTPCVLTEGIDTWYDEWDERTYYNTPSLKVGDVLTVHYNDGRGAVAYTLTNDPDTYETNFVSANGDVIKNDWETIEVSHNQRDKAWTLGSDNFFFVKYSGKQAEVPVTIKENTVNQISFRFNRDITVYATSCKIIKDESGNEHRQYDIPDFKDGDVLVITDKNGDSKDYVYGFDETDGEHYFVNGDEKIHLYDLEVDPYLLGDNWSVGGDNYFSVRYMGVETQVKVNLIDTDVEKITFTKKNPIVLKEQQNGEWRYNYRGVKYFWYDAMLGEVGDVLTVKYLNGQTVSYTVKFDNEQEGAYLEAPNGDRLTQDDVDVYETQYDEAWTVGGENEYYVVFHGITCSVPVSVNHDYTTRVVAPKSNAVGYTLHTCKACDASYKTDYKAPTGKPAGVKCVARTAAAEKISWNKTAGVSGYQVQISNAAGNKWGSAYNAKTATSYTFSKLTAGSNYKFRVRFYITVGGKNYYGAWTTISSPTLPKATKVTSVAAAKKAITPKWGKVAGVTGYQIQYSTSAKFAAAKAKTVKGATKSSLKLTSLKSGARYYVRVRTYKTIGGKNYYSAWSGSKSAVAKR